MADETTAAPESCLIPGCTDPATRERMIHIGPSIDRIFLVCDKHETGDIDINSLDLGEWGE